MRNSPGGLPGAFFARDRDQHPPAYAPGYKTSVTRSPTKPLIALDNTLSEMTGPVFGHDRLGPLDDDLILNFAKPGELPVGPRIVVHGRVLDENARLSLRSSGGPGRGLSCCPSAPETRPSPTPTSSPT